MVKFPLLKDEFCSSSADQKMMSTKLKNNGELTSILMHILIHQQLEMELLTFDLDKEIEQERIYQKCIKCEIFIFWILSIYQILAYMEELLFLPRISILLQRKKSIGLLLCLTKLDSNMTVLSNDSTA